MSKKSFIRFMAHFVSIVFILNQSLWAAGNTSSTNSENNESNLPNAISQGQLAPPSNSNEASNSINVKDIKSPPPLPTGASNIQLDDRDTNVTCEDSGTQFKFDETDQNFDKLKSKSTPFTSSECDRTAMDKIWHQASLLGNDSLSNSAETTMNESGTNMAAIEAKKSECEGKLKLLEEDKEKVDKSIEQDKKKCFAKAKEGAERSCMNKPTPAEQKQCKEAKQKSCEKKCAAAAMALGDKVKAEESFFQKHWGKMALGALALLGILGAMMAGGKKNKKEQEASLNGAPTATPTPTPVPSTNTASTDTSTTPAATDSTSSTPATTATPAETQASTAAWDQAACNTPNKPLSCLQTVTCDIKCTAERYGVDPNTKELENVRISANPTPASGQASSGSALSGSPGDRVKGSGNGGAPQGISSETAAVINDSMTKSGGGNYGSSEDDSYDGSSGGGSGAGSNSQRDPAAAKSASNSGNAASNSLADSGPLNKKDLTLFRAINIVTRSQCIKDLVDCTMDK